MTNQQREVERSDDTVNRRTILKGTAAAGLAGTAITGSASADGWKELRFQSVSEKLFEYHVQVSDELKRAPNRDGGDTQIDERTATGAARNGNHDDWFFKGEITKLELRGPGTVLVDGTVIRDTTKKLPHTIEIHAEGETVQYEFRVSGQVEKGDRADSDDRILDGNVVRGAVGGSGTDDYHYSGDVAFSEADGPLTVTLELNQ